MEMDGHSMIQLPSMWIGTVMRILVRLEQKWLLLRRGVAAKQVVSPEDANAGRGTLPVVQAVNV